MRTFLRTLMAPFLGTLLLSFAFTANVKAQTGTATITTDQADYPPGSTAIIAGSGFQSGEIVTLQVLHYPTCCDDATDPSHKPWTDTADADGNVSSTWLVPSDADELGATLR